MAVRTVASYNWGHKTLEDFLVDVWFARCKAIFDSLNENIVSALPHNSPENLKLKILGY